MKQILIKSGKVVFPHSVRETDLLIAGDKIKNIGPAKQYDQIINAAGLYVLPGLIDIHYHGLYMFPIPEKIEEQLARMRNMLARRGVAGFLATFPAAPIPVLTNCLKVLAAAAHKELKEGAHLLGVHLEGPFLSKSAKGAQPENAIVEFDPESKEMRALFDASKGLVKIMTFAPEQKFSRELVKVMVASKIIPSLGHSATSYEDALAFAGLGVQGITHIFNGMSGIHHRTPGVALAGLDEKFYKEVIVDGFHVHPAIVKMIWDLTPRRKFILITDMVGDEEPLDFEPPRLNNQTFAGSRLRLLRAVRNLVKFTGASVPDAVAAASAWPAKILGLKNLGSIREGGEADLVLVDDKFSLKKIIFRGELLDGVSDV
jgi:N-acetylglucosamine-6-phosphate deacetylase